MMYIKFNEPKLQSFCSCSMIYHTEDINNNILLKRNVANDANLNSSIVNWPIFCYGDHSLSDILPYTVKNEWHWNAKLRVQHPSTTWTSFGLQKESFAVFSTCPPGSFVFPLMAQRSVPAFCILPEHGLNPATNPAHVFFFNYWTAIVEGRV